MTAAKTESMCCWSLKAFAMLQAKLKTMILMKGIL
jgi:hypothetical protein